MASRIARAAVLLLGGVSAGLDAAGVPSSGPAFAAECVVDTSQTSETGKRKKPRSVPNITEPTFKRLSDAQELIDTEQWAAAMELLNTMVQRSRRYNGNERGQVHNMLAYANYEMGDINATIHHYEQVLAQVPDIAEAVENTTLNQLSKLYFIQGNSYDGDEALPWYQKALARMEEWLAKNENPGPDAHFYMAQIYYQMKDFANAIERLELVVALARKRCRQVKESWWTMLQFLYFEQENWPKVIEILEILVKDYSKRVYWVTLASIYGETDQPGKQLWTMEAAHVGGYLEKESDIRSYGGLLLQSEIPNRASKHLQQGFDDGIVERNLINLQTLGQAYQLAQDGDKAIPVFEEAAKIAEDGVTYDRLSALYVEKDEFQKCQTAAENALEKGGLKNPLRTKITLGICQFNQDKLATARKLFAEIRREARRDRMRNEERAADQWIIYIDSESERRAQLARGL